MRATSKSGVADFNLLSVTCLWAPNTVGQGWSFRVDTGPWSAVGPRVLPVLSLWGAREGAGIVVWWGFSRDLGDWLFVHWRRSILTLSQRLQLDQYL